MQVTQMYQNVATCAHMGHKSQFVRVVCLGMCYFEKINRSSRFKAILSKVFVGPAFPKDPSGPIGTCLFRMNFSKGIKQNVRVSNTHTPASSLSVDQNIHF